MSSVADETKAKEVIQILLEQLKIEHVISVDDEYAANAESISDILLEYPHLCESVSELASLDARRPQEVVRVEVANRLANTLQDRLEEIQFSLKTGVGGDEVNVLGRLADFIKSERVRYEAMSLHGWQKRYPNLEKVGQDRTTLVLFDQSFETEGEDAEAGIRQVKQLLTKTSSGKVLTGLLTSKCSAGEECHRWEKVAEKEGIERHRFLYISKERLEDDLMGFALMLKLTALSPGCVELLDATCKTARNAFDAAAAQCLQSVSVYDFEHIVFTLSRNEGTWEPETLLRILFIFLRTNVAITVRNDNELCKLFERVRSVSQIETTPKSMTDHASWRVQRLEMYDSGEHINKLHLPLECGDVFLRKGEGQAKDRIYVLIAQPCDFMVRRNGRREGRGAEEAILCELLVERGNGDYWFEFKYFDEQKQASAWVSLASRITINPCMLDLAVFSPTGDTSIGTKDQPVTALIPSWKRRFEILQKQAKKIITNYMTMKSKGLTDDLACLATPSASVDGKWRPIIDTSAQSLSFGLRRIGRLRQPWAGSLLKAYALYMTREAYEVDLGRELNS